MSQVSYGTITITDTNDIESITVEYNRNQSSSNAPSATDSGWSTTRPDWAQGYYIWQRTRVHKSGTTADKDVIGTAVCITGSTGSSGTSVTISSIKYAVSTTESQPADSSFTYTSVPTVAEGAWLWTLVIYSNGSKAYTKSKQGVSGDSITVSKVEYQSGTSPTSAPTGTWKTSIPTVAEGNYLWTKTTYSDGNYTYSVAKQGKSGTSVSISSTSITYQVSTSQTTTPTGEWKTTVQPTTTGQYLWTRTIVTYSDGNSTTSYSVAAHGATGTSISISSIKYAVSSTDSQPADSSFTYTSVPTVNEGQWLWTLTTYSNGSKMYTKSKQGKSGSNGQSLTATKTEYTIAANNVTINLSNHTSYTWTTNTPDYDASKPTYWGRITNTYANPTKTEYLFYKDEAITKAVADAVIANSIAQQTIEDAQGALSIATGINQHFFSIPSKYSESVPAGSYITEINVDEFKRSPSGGNLLTRSDGVWLRNGADILASLQGTGLNFLIPTGTYKGRKSLEILGGTTPALKLYDAQNNNAVATLNSNGLVLSKGGIRVNTVGSNNGVYISSENLGSKVTSLDADKINWRAVIGSKFGVDSEGNLYANEAHISGEITASKLTISSNATINDTSGLIRNDAIDIGGRNLVLNTAEPQKGKIGSRTTITDDYATLAGSTADWDATWGTSKMEPGLLDGTTVYTVSFEYRSTAALSDTLLVISGSAEIIDSSSWTRSKYVNWKGSEALPSTGGEWVKHSLDPRTISLSQLTSGSGDVNSFFLQLYNRSNEVSMDVRHFKLEKGNKATDWTPAPEDVKSYTDTAIYEVVPQIGKAQTQATEDAKAYSNGILASFSSKFTVSPENISSEVAAIQNGETLVSRINQLPDSVKIEAKNVEIVDRYESYIELAADEANPYILLGKRENNAMLLRITNERMGFEVNSEEVAYLAPDALHVQKQISFGDFIMKQRENGHLSIIRTTRGGN